MTQTQSVLRKHDAKELQQLKDSAKEAYLNTEHGYSAYASTDPATGRAIGGFVIGAYQAELVVYATDILKTYLQKINEGYTLHPFEVQPYAGQSMSIYFYKPQPQQDVDLEGIFSKIEADYAKSIEDYNEALIEREVQMLLAGEERKRSQDRLKQASEDAARIRGEVEAALHSTRKTAKTRLEGKA